MGKEEELTGNISNRMNYKDIRARVNKHYLIIQVT